MNDVHSPSIAVVIPVHNGGQAFQVCLGSLSALLSPAQETIVVDDDSSDGSDRAAAAAGATVLHTCCRRGPAHARNLGAQEAESEVLLFLDADVSVQPDVVERVARAFTAEPELSALFGSYDDTPAVGNFPSQYRNLLHHYVHQAADEEAFTFWTGCGAVRREVFVSLGGFDEQRYREPSIEDIELGYRLKRAGHRVRLLKDLQVKHLKDWGRLELIRCDFVQRAVPWSRLILRHRHLANDLNIGWSGRLSVLAAGGLVASVLIAIWWLPALVFAGLCGTALLVLNGSLYRFFARRRGVLFAARAIPWHWFYFLYSGMAFCLALGEQLGKRVLRWIALTDRDPRGLNSREEPRQPGSRLVK